MQKAMAIGMDSSESKARLAHLHEDLQASNGICNMWTACRLDFVDYNYLLP